MSLKISPTSLQFKRPLTTHRVCKMCIRNNRDMFFAFKIKTTSPKSYGVHPNSGFISPNSEKDIAVTKFAMEQEPDMSVECSDRFMVLLAHVDAADVKTPIDLVWENIISRREHAIKKILLACVYQGTITCNCGGQVLEITKDKVMEKPVADAWAHQLTNEPQLFSCVIMLLVVFNICLWWWLY